MEKITEIENLLQTIEKQITEYENLILEKRKELVDMKKKYALVLSPYKPGDIIEDHLGKGRVISLHPYTDIFDGTMKVRYHCENLTKNGGVSKVKPYRDIYQPNIKK